MDPQERYEIKRRIEQSGVCAVYEGFDKQLQRKVAIKRLLSEDESGKDYDDLMRECQSLSALASANIVSLHDVGRDEDGPFMVLELLEGESLQKIIDKGPIELDDFYQIAEQSLEGLMAAHEIHLVHRDLKPSNINVHRKSNDKLSVKLQDFGLAKFSLEPSIRTIAHSNTLFGSIYYMAPEQFERQPLDNRTDIYSLGAVFYHMLAGQYPYDGDSGAQVMIGAMNGGATHLAELRPDLDPSLCDWVMAMLAKEADHRPLSCEKALEHLQHIKKGPTAAPAPAAAATAPTPTPAPTPAAATPPAQPAAAETPAATPAPISTPIPDPAHTTFVAEQPATSAAPNPVPSGPVASPQPAAAAPAAGTFNAPTVELAGAPPQSAPNPMPTQQMAVPPAYAGNVPGGPQPTVQMMTGAPAAAAQAQPTMQMATPAPRITGPINRAATAATPHGGPTLVGGSRVAPLPKGSSFATKQSSPLGWIFLAGIAAVAAVVCLVMFTGPSSTEQSSPVGGSEAPAAINPAQGADAPEAKTLSTLAQTLKLPSDAEQLFRSRDTNGDFQLSLEEFCGDASGEQKIELETAFDYLDQNTDLRLVLSELYRAYRASDFFPN